MSSKCFFSFFFIFKSKKKAKEKRLFPDKIQMRKNKQTNNSQVEFQEQQQLIVFTIKICDNKKQRPTPYTQTPLPPKKTTLFFTFDLRFSVCFSHTNGKIPMTSLNNHVQILLQCFQQKITKCRNVSATLAHRGGGASSFVNVIKNNLFVFPLISSANCCGGSWCPARTQPKRRRHKAGETKGGD